MPSERNALFVRLTADQAERLERAAGRLPARKKDLIGGLVERYVDPSSPSGLEALRELLGEPDRRRHFTVDLGPEPPVVGHAEFRPAPPLEVLSAAEAAELLSVPEADLVALAERSELPGRRIGEAWRFSRQALLDWLAAGA
jgi:excisionase family DNA binding protein